MHEPRTANDLGTPLILQTSARSFLNLDFFGEETKSILVSLESLRLCEGNYKSEYIFKAPVSYQLIAQCEPTNNPMQKSEMSIRLKEKFLYRSILITNE